ncbi:ABC transporter permease [Larkinella insperata]|uniref:ABC transporter permease n=1 Tax=Larkinella insperata TaxID=332158 RepID=A0ABW3QMM1_9BACT|nr:ABC transporter permease [Larkinella insperata]
MKPPRWATWLLEAFGHPDSREEVQGDLLELYAYWVQTVGERKARWRYGLSALKLLRPLARRKSATEYSTPFFLSPVMIRNYLKVAFRNLVKNKVYSFINIGGLAVGMAVAMLIGLWLYDELSFDKYHKNYDRIAQVMQQQTSNGKIYTQTAIPFPLGSELRTKYGNDFKYLSMASWEGEHILTYGDKKFSKSGCYMEPDAPKMFSLTLLKGSEEGLKEPNSILLSESVAKAVFGKADPLNKLMKIDNKLDVKVTGVYEDIPYNAYFRDLTFIAPWDLYTTSEPWIQRSRDQWGDNSYQLFAQINDQTSYESVSKRILRAKYNNVEESDKKYNAQIFLHPMRDWHLRSNWEEGVQTGGLIEYVWLFGIVGIFVLLLACINFMNLSTARSEKRAKEIGIRKAVGSVRSQLIGQFLSESLLVVAVAFVLALLLVLLSLPWFNEVANKRMTILWTHPGFWLLGIGFTLLTGLISGSYPALYLSSFEPIKALKGNTVASRLQTVRFVSIPRKVLVVLQFTVSVSLIIGTIIVYRQIQFSKNRPIGYSRDGLMMIQMKSPEFYGKFELLRSELKKSGAIVEMAESSSPITSVWSNNGGFEWAGKDPNLDADFSTIWVTHEFGKTVGWQFKEGRDFSRVFSTDSASLVVNEAAVKFMGIKDPVGTVVRWGADSNARAFKIVGVIKDMIMDSPYDPVKQSFYLLDYDNVNWIDLKLNPAKSASESVAQIEAVFRRVIPSAPFDYKFADQEFAAKFAAEERIGTLATGFAVLAIFISCLGMFGLASFVVEQRTKEIGVRKVLGASVLNLWGLLSKDFVFLVLIAFGIATPIAYYCLHGWLQKYEYRTEISWWVFAASGAGALTITLLTVSFQSIKAALMNPVKSLRSE